MSKAGIVQQPHLSIGIGLDVGRARRGMPNQDSVGIYSDYCQDQQHLAAKGLLFVIADGMGGAAGGEVASKTAVEVIGRSYYADPDHNVTLSLEHAIDMANTQIYQLGQDDPSLNGLGTTLVVAVILGNSLVVANVGDSRAYQLRNGELFSLTLDHTVVQEQLREGLLTSEEASVHPRRHVLSRNLGFQPWAEPEFLSNTLLQGDKLLLCSDGLWGPVDDAEIEQLLQSYRGQDAAATLVERANEHGGPDNISAIVIDFDGFAAAFSSPVLSESAIVEGEQTAPLTRLVPHEPADGVAPITRLLPEEVAAHPAQITRLVLDEPVVPQVAPATSTTPQLLGESMPLLEGSKTAIYRSAIEESSPPQAAPVVMAPTIAAHEGGSGVARVETLVAAVAETAPKPLLVPRGQRSHIVNLLFVSGCMIVLLLLALVGFIAIANGGGNAGSVAGAARLTATSAAQLAVPATSWSTPTTFTNEPAVLLSRTSAAPLAGTPTTTLSATSTSMATTTRTETSVQSSDTPTGTTGVETK